MQACVSLRPVKRPTLHEDGSQGREPSRIPYSFGLKWREIADCSSSIFTGFVM